MTDHHYDLIKKTIRIFLIVFFMCCSSVTAALFGDFLQP